MSRAPWIGVMLPVQDLGAGLQAPFDMARAADRAGLDSVWVGDHLSFRRPIVEAIVTASMIAATTTMVNVGFGVLQAAMRHPVWLAKQLGTLAALSGGRLEIGVGIGGENPAEWAAAGVPVDERVGRTSELLAILPGLLAGRPLEHSGRYYDFDAPALLPAPERVPKVWVGGRSDGALRRTAQLADGWLGLWVDEERLARSVATMREAASEAGRPLPESALVVPVVVEEDAARAREHFVHFAREQYGLEYERIERWGIAGSAATIAERLRSLADAGASGFVLMSAAADPLAEIDRLAEVRDHLRLASVPLA